MRDQLKAREVQPWISPTLSTDGWFAARASNKQLLQDLASRAATLLNLWAGDLDALQARSSWVPPASAQVSRSRMPASTGSTGFSACSRV
jgi:hypothetical protein